MTEPEPVIYDVESFPNAFTVVFKPVGKPGVFFEISDRRRDNYALWHYIAKLQLMVGFNNLHYDWPMIQHFLDNPNCDAAYMYQKNCDIIGGPDERDKVDHTIWNPAIPQIDLYLIHHFNNKAKSTSLKKLQFNMRSKLVMESPIAFGTHLSYDEIDQTIRYNCHDVMETGRFWLISQPAIELRRAINPRWINQSDTGLGRKYFEQQLEASGISCFDENRKPRVTHRPGGVLLGDILLPYLQFRTPAIRAALERLSHVLVRDDWDAEADKMLRSAAEPDGAVYVRGTKKQRAEDLEAYGHEIHFMEDFSTHSFELGGIEVTMGLGGIHGSMERAVLKNCDMMDLDVTSFYPSIAIANRLFPAHLGIGFCHVYAALLAMRLQSAKGTPENAALKLALNSVFGSSGSVYTCFYDLAFMLGITINGQFLILSLAELLLTVEGVRLVQINTDGLTIIIPDGKREQVGTLYRQWAEATRLNLETKDYKEMYIRDVNNYIAVDSDGKRKRKGCYEPQKQWHQNQSMPIIRRAAEACMVDGADIEDFIRANDDNGWEFLLRLDLSRAASLVLGDGSTLRGVVRYYVSETGTTATKHMNKLVTKIHAGGNAEIVGKRGNWTCSECGHFANVKTAVQKHIEETHSSKITICQEYNGEPIAYDMRFYANEARKLVLT